MSIIPLGTLDITTDRLLLRKFTIKDAYNVFNNWVVNLNVTKYLDWKPHKNIEETKTVINKWVAAYESGFYFNWAITLKEEYDYCQVPSPIELKITGKELAQNSYQEQAEIFRQAPIGAVGLNSVDIKNESGEIGFLLCENFWNQKITTEAVGFCLHYLFNSACFNQINARTNDLNIYSIKILRNLGFVSSSSEYVLTRENFNN